MAKVKEIINEDNILKILDEIYLKACDGIPKVNVPVEEMADMISANRSYQTAVQMATSAKKMMQATLQIGTNPNM